MRIAVGLALILAGIVWAALCSARKHQLDEDYRLIAGWPYYVLTVLGVLVAAVGALVMVAAVP